MSDEKIIHAEGTKSDLEKKKKVSEPVVTAEDNIPVSFLTDEKKRELDKKAQEKVDQDLRKQEEEEYLAKQERKELLKRKQKTGNVDQDEIVDFVCDLADFAASIVVNNVTYYHGFSYRVPRHVCRDLESIAARTWDHDADIHGEKWNPRKRRNQKLSPRNAA